MATRQDSGGSTHSTRSTSSHRSASAKHAAQPEPEVIVETVNPPVRFTLTRILIAFLVIGLLRFLILWIAVPWMVDPYGKEPTELRCVVHQKFLYCNRDCVPRFQNEEKLASFNEAHPDAPNYTINRPFVLGQSTKYCISPVELDIVWLPLKLQMRKEELVQLKEGNHNGPWLVVA